MSGTLPLDTHTNWWELVVQRAELTPDRMFLDDPVGRSLTFGQYRTVAEEVAAGFAELGMAADQTVSYQLPSGLECAVLFAALSRLGVKQNPIITMLRRAEVGLIVDQLHSDWLIVPINWRGFSYKSMAEEIVAGTDCQLYELPIAEGVPGPIVLPQGDPSTLPRYEHREDVRWFFYSSGTTAVPKGAKHTDASVMAASNGCVQYYGFDAESKFPAATPMTHIGGMMVLTTQMRLGFRSLVLDRFDPVESPGVMARYGATNLGSAVPFFLAYLDAQKRHGAEPLFPNLRVCAAGGAPMPPEVHRRVKSELGGRGIVNSWGLTECPNSTSVSPDDPEEAFDGTVGRACFGVDIRIVTSDGRLAGVDEEGELRLKGPNLFSGYVDSALDEEAFDADGYLRTGDLGRRDASGYVTITGRIKDIIIRNAENISAVEVENVLHQHESINDVAVIGLPDRRTGERCCAVIVVAAGAERPTLAELVGHCQAKGLATQKAPEQLEFIEEMPRNSMGKILKSDLRVRFAAPS
ncbi:MAG: class I adenylate-forming enzyme family protein [Acidimicrobiia bacterium]